MLILKRNAGSPHAGLDTLVVSLPDGRRMTLRVLDVVGRQVKLGFTAPPDVTIHRSEIQADIDRRGGDRGR